MIVDRELDAVIRAGMFRDRDHAFQEAVETLFTVRPNLRTEAAVEMFRSGELSLLRASEMAGLDFESFRRLLQDRGIPWKSRAKIRLKWTEPSLISFWNPEHDRCGHQHQERLSRLRFASAAPAHVS